VFLGPRPPGEDPDIYKRDGTALTLAEARSLAGVANCVSHSQCILRG